MPSATARRVFPCREFEPVEMPLDLLMSDGQLQLYPEAEKYFDLDYRAGRLVVAPKSYVGLIPINDRVAIHVLPRVPIDNIFYLLHRTSAVIRFIEGHLRSYAIETRYEGDPIEILASQFSSIAQRLFNLGLLRQYIPSNDPPQFSGTLDVTDTVISFRSKGISYRHSWASDELTANIIENALIKSALVRVVDYLGRKRDSVAKKQLATLRALLYEFDSVETVVPAVALTETDVARLISRLPQSHKEYSSILWLAFLIHARRGLSIEAVGNLSFDTFVVNLADVFEDYLRVIITEHFAKLGRGYRVKDGNKDQVSLFANSDQFKVKPDIYVAHNRAALAVLDAKYKPSLKAADRYEVIAFCEALQAKRAVILSPVVAGEHLSELGTTPGGIAFWHARIDLSAKDMKAEELRFLASVEELVLGGGLS